MFKKKKSRDKIEKMTDYYFFFMRNDLLLIFWFDQSRIHGPTNIIIINIIKIINIDK